MTTEDKELLLKDLCARLPYGVKAVLTRTNCNDFINKVSEKDLYSFRTGRPLEEDYGQHDYYKVVVTDIKPYLFPLSNMTEEQRNEYEDALVYHDYVNGGWTMAKTFDDEYVVPYWFVDFCNKYHFDYRGLIEKNLANDATGLNIY